MKVVAKNTAFGRDFNREFLQQMLDTITSFLTEKFHNHEIRMRIHVTTGRYIGSIWVERVYGMKKVVTGKERYTQFHFVRDQPKPLFSMLLWEKRSMSWGKNATEDLKQHYDALLEEHKPDEKLRMLRRS